ncbi:MAG: LysR family transcriptional regulator [Sphingomonadales bacterium]|nr:LysR family transcriptional regulator [Sphingomonadales bacterium]
MSIDWEAQRAFLAVVREGSLSGAARALAVAQPTIRRRIERLEASVGAPLFVRAPNGLIPTERAEALMVHAETMALAADAFQRSASADVGRVAGTVRISASEIVAIEILPDIVSPLMAAHPELAIELSASNRNEDLLRREADIAVRMVPPVQEALVARRIGAIPLGLHAHADYFAARGHPGSLAEVQDHALIGPARNSPILRTLQARGFLPEVADFTFRSDSDIAQLAAIRAGLGVGVCQVPLARREPQLVHLLPDAFSFPLETWVVTHEDLRNVARVRAVFDALVDGLTRYIRS